MKKNITTIILMVILIFGLSLLLYPTISNYWNSFHQSQMVGDYVEHVANMDDDTIGKMLQVAQAYNERLVNKKLSFAKLNDEEMEEYLSVLDVTGTGVMGYIDIPSIKCTLPIYHGTDEDVLQIAIGHLEWSSLPIGGVNTHCVLSGHRGLPSARLFTDIDRLVEGDLFYLDVLGETLAYEVDQILIVLPEEMSSLKIEDEMDYCTLITCTPYGVNTHRLLVRGHRIDNVKTQNVRVTADAIQIDTTLVAPFVAAPMLLVLFIILIVSTGKKKRKNK